MVSLDVGGGVLLDDCSHEELLCNADCDESVFFADEPVMACDEHEMSSTKLVLLSLLQASNPMAAEIMAPITVTRFMFSPWWRKNSIRMFVSKLLVVSLM